MSGRSARAAIWGEKGHGGANRDRCAGAGDIGRRLGWAVAEFQRGATGEGGGRCRAPGLGLRVVDGVNVTILWRAGRAIGGTIVHSEAPSEYEQPAVEGTLTSQARHVDVALARLPRGWRMRVPGKRLAMSRRNRGGTEESLVSGAQPTQTRE